MESVLNNEKAIVVFSGGQAVQHVSMQKNISKKLNS